MFSVTKPPYGKRLSTSLLAFLMLSVGFLGSLLSENGFQSKGNFIVFANAQQHAGAAPSSERLLTTGDLPMERVKMFIDESEVMVFAKSYCPYCKRTRSLFDRIVQENGELDIFVNILDLDTLPEDDGRLMQQALMELTGQRTVPNVFVAGNHVGGNDDTHELFHSGELLEALEDIASSREL